MSVFICQCCSPFYHCAGQSFVTLWIVAPISSELVFMAVLACCGQSRVVSERSTDTEDATMICVQIKAVLEKCFNPMIQVPLKMFPGVRSTFLCEKLFKCKDRSDSGIVRLAFVLWKMDNYLNSTNKRHLMWSIWSEDFGRWFIVHLLKSVFLEQLILNVDPTDSSIRKGITTSPWKICYI